MANGKLKTISENLVDLNGEKVEGLVNEALEEGYDPIDILEKGLGKGLSEVGDKFEKGEYFITELTMAGKIVEDNMEILLPALKSGSRGKETQKYLIGTVKGDVHDIGKNIVRAMMVGLGFEVIDLGVDVLSEEFLEAVKEHKPAILGLSALLTTTLEEMKKVVETLEEEGLREGLIIMVGGRPVTEDFAKEIGADYYGENAMDASKKAKEAIGRK